ncbi:hypothetical protein ACHAXN_007375 [Cyclotella atomus]
MSTSNDSSSLSKYGMCPYCASRSQCLVCMKKSCSAASSSSATLSEDPKVVPNVKGNTDQSHIPVVTPVKQQSLTEEGRGKNPDSICTKDGTESNSGESSSPGEASPNKAYPMQLIIRKRTRHGALPLQSSKQYLPGKVKLSHSVAVVSADENGDRCATDATIKICTPEDIETEVDAKESNEPTYDVVDLTSDDGKVDFGNFNIHEDTSQSPRCMSPRIDETAKAKRTTTTSYQATFNDVKRSTDDQLGNGNDSADESVMSRFSKTDYDSCCSDDDVDKKTKESLSFPIDPNAHCKKKSRKPRKSSGNALSRLSMRIPRQPESTRTIQTEQKNELVHFEGEHDDYCYICDDGGELVCCDYCSKAFHCQCHIPPLLEIPGDDWMCCECKATLMTRASKCGSCYECVRENCGACKYCLDKPHFGGQNILKQVCNLKRCPNKRYAPPAKLTEEQKEETIRRVVDVAQFGGPREEAQGTNIVHGPFSWAR